MSTQAERYSTTHTMAENQYFKVKSDAFVSESAVMVRGMFPQVHPSMKINAIDKCT